MNVKENPRAWARRNRRAPRRDHAEDERHFDALKARRESAPVASKVAALLVGWAEKLHGEQHEDMMTVFGWVTDKADAGIELEAATLANVMEAALKAARIEP